MRVADLQQYLSDLAKFLHSADAKKPAGELARIGEGLQPFRDYDLAQFGDFLARAEEYSRTGEIPVVPPKKAPGRRPAAKPKADLPGIKAEVARLYVNGSSPGVTIESIEGLRPRLAPLTKPQLLEVAGAIDLVGIIAKTKADVLNAIVARVKSIKQSAIRTSIIDRPGTEY